MIAALLAACTPAPADRPLNPAERAALPGTIYWLQGDEAPQVVRYQLAEGAPTPITPPGSAAFFSAADHRGRHLALTIDDHLVLTDPQGRDPRPMADGAGVAWYPVFSPNGESVLFESSRASFRDLYRVERATGVVRRLTDNREGNFDGVWSPDGGRIAFASSRHGQLDLFVMNADGTEQRRLTRHPGDSIKPRWTPDGQQLLFLSGRDGRDDLYVVSASGGEVRSISADVTGKAQGGAFVERYDLTPDGKHLVFAVRTPKVGSKLWSWEVATAAVRRLSGPEHDDTDPAVSPDGRYVVFTSKQDGRSGISLMRIDGGQRTRLADDASAWRPRWVEVAEGRGDS